MPLIRARLVVQVHPGPPFKSPVNTRRFSLFPFLGSPSKNRFVNRLSTSRLAGWHYTQGVKALRVKAERLASIRLCREGGRVTSKDVEGSARGLLSLFRFSRISLKKPFFPEGIPRRHAFRRRHRLRLEPCWRTGERAWQERMHERASRGDAR
jgi:hypothetical protein